MNKIVILYTGGMEETVHLSNERTSEELNKFVNGLSEAAKRQWLLNIRKNPYVPPWGEGNYKSRGPSC
jgi:hypothetical protein